MVNINIVPTSIAARVIILSKKMASCKYVVSFAPEECQGHEARSFVVTALSHKCGARRIYRGSDPFLGAHYKTP